MSTLNLTQARRIYKRLKGAIALPDPCRSYEEYKKLNNDDLPEMDRLELRNEWNRAELALLLLDGDLLLWVRPDGGQVTARAYLLNRIAAIRRLLKGVA